MLARLGVTRLRLLMGTSMGCMHGFVWAETHPDFARAMMPMACLPVEIAGHNRMWRRAGGRGDPQRSGLARAAITRPSRVQGLRTAVSLLQVAGLAPLYLQRAYPDRATRRGLYRRAGRRATSRTRDANDLIYQLEASPHLQSAAQPRADPGADDLGQQRRRFHQPAPITASPKPRRGGCRPRATSSSPPPPKPAATAPTPGRASGSRS